MERLLKPAQVAGILGVSRAWIYELIALDAIPSVRIGRTVRVPADSLNEWIHKRKTAGVMEAAVPHESGLAGGTTDSDEGARDDEV
jgi:excisionase family DNA binding protein